MSAPPKWFRVVAVVALLWNLLGCFAFLSDLRLSPDDLARMSVAQQTLYHLRPLWATLATGVAVFGGALGCLGLALSKRWALPLLILSLTGVLVQDFGLFVLAHAASIAGPLAVTLQAVVLIVAIALVMLARSANARGWLGSERGGATQ